MNRYLICNLFLFFCFTLNAQDEAKSHKNQAFQYFRQYRFHEVIKHFNEHKPNKPESIQLLAKAYQQLGQFDKARESYLQAIKIDSSNLILKNELAKLYIRMNRNMEALMLYDELKKQELSNPYYWKKTAQLLAKLQHPIEALGAYQQVLQLNQDDNESSLSMAKLFVDIEEYNTADSILVQQMKKVNDKTPLLKLQLQIHYRQKNFPIAIKIAESLFNSGDSSLLTLKLSGIAYHRAGESLKAIKLLSDIVERINNSEIIHFYLGLAYRDNHDYERATEHFEKAIDEGVSENIGTYYTQLGASFEEIGNYKSSIEAYKVAYGSSKDKILLYHLARNYDKYYKDKTVALNYYKKYLSFNDTVNLLYYNYSKNRVKEIRVARHFELDTL